MKRRRRPEMQVAPRRLYRLQVSEWPGLSPADAYEAWKAARRDWCAANGFNYVGTPGNDLPFGPLGDPIDQLCAQRAARMTASVI